MLWHVRGHLDAYQFKREARSIGGRAAARPYIEKMEEIRRRLD